MVKVFRLLFWLLVRLCAAPTSRWKGCAAIGPQRIYFANHQSHFDWLLIRYALPSSARDSTRPVVAAEYWAGTWFKRLLTRSVFKTVPLPRAGTDDPAARLEAAVQALGEGVSLIMFPEGTRGDGGEPKPFRPGLYHLARRHPQAQLIPVWIDGTHRVMPKGAMFPRRVPCSVTFGAPLKVAASEDMPGFLQAARAAVLALRPHG